MPDRAFVQVRAVSLLLPLTSAYVLVAEYVHRHVRCPLLLCRYFHLCFVFCCVVRVVWSVGVRCWWLSPSHLTKRQTRQDHWGRTVLLHELVLSCAWLILSVFPHYHSCDFIVPSPLSREEKRGRMSVLFCVFRVRARVAVLVTRGGGRRRTMATAAKREFVQVRFGSVLSVNNN